MGDHSRIAFCKDTVTVCYSAPILNTRPGTRPSDSTCSPGFTHAESIHKTNSELGCRTCLGDLERLRGEVDQT